MKALGVGIGTTAVSARSSLWRQITADLLGLPLLVFPQHPGSAMGVAFVAGVSSGLFQQWKDIDRFLQGGVLVEPDDSNHATYEKTYQVYRDIYTHLKGDFATMSEIVSHKNASS